MKRRLISIGIAFLLAVSPVGSVYAESLILEETPVTENGASSGEGIGTDEILADEASQTEENFPDTAGKTEENGALESGTDGQSLNSNVTADGQTNVEVDTEAGTGTVSGEGLILSVEEVETPEAAEEEIVAVVEDGPETLADSGLAANASLSRSRSAITSYDGSYGAQLSGDALIVYQNMVSVYVDQKKAGEIERIELSYTTEFTVSPTLDESGKVTSWNLDSNEAYEDAKNELRAAIQPAFDAFVYDYPEVFWLSGMNYIPVVKAYSDSTAKISAVILKPKERYEGASAEIAQFDAAVDEVVTTISAGLSSNASRYETIKAIHDYICNNASYEFTDYSWTAAGVFLKGGNVVCEGYAKAFKILCDKFGIETALVPGGALKNDGTREGHMWNHVKMEDGNWYLVDTTWDDQKTYISTTYLLTGSAKIGFSGQSIGYERQIYSCFSNSAYTQNFGIPAISSVDYLNSTGTHTHDWVEDTARRVEPTCTQKGTTTYVCSTCRAEMEEVLNCIPHVYTNYVYNNNATCTEDGTKTAVCDLCNTETKTLKVYGTKLGHSYSEKVIKAPTCTETGIKGQVCGICGETGETETIPALGHNYIDKIIKAPTCTESGTKMQVCSRCPAEGEKGTVPALGHSYMDHVIQPTCTEAGSRIHECIRCKSPGATEILPALGHSFTHYVSNGDATALTDGTKTARCDRCSVTSTVTDPGSKLAATIQLNATSLTMKVGQSTTAVTVSGLAKGDSITDWISGNTSIVKVSKTGKITAKKVGSTTVTVTLASGISGTIKVKVQKGTVKTTKISGLSKKLTVKRGKTKQLSPAVTPLTSQQKITYSSSNKKVATVSSKGLIRAKAAGTAKITVKSGSKKYVITVTVPKTATTKITNVPSSITLKVGKSRTLKAKRNPSNSDYKLTYKTSNKKVAAVSATGKITAKKKGTATITVTSGKIKVKCKVTVK